MNDNGHAPASSPREVNHSLLDFKKHHDLVIRDSLWLLHQKEANKSFSCLSNLVGHTATGILHLQSLSLYRQDRTFKRQERWIWRPRRKVKALVKLKANTSKGILLQIWIGVAAVKRNSYICLGTNRRRNKKEGNDHLGWRENRYKYRSHIRHLAHGNEGSWIMTIV